MNTIDDVWHWYQQSRFCLKATSRLAAKHWNTFGNDHALFKDNLFKEMNDVDLWYAASLALLELDDQAILKLFSIFEAQSRRLLQQEMNDLCPATASATCHSVMSHAMDEITKGPMARVSHHYFAGGAIDSILHAQLGMLREYRNWLAHGKFERKPGFVTVDDAYQLLKITLSTMTKHFR